MCACMCFSIINFRLFIPHATRILVPMDYLKRRFSSGESTDDILLIDRSNSFVNLRSKLLLVIDTQHIDW
jgi:hypothetical protein